MEEENEIDQLFKRGLNDPEIPFNELDWEKMERKLDAQGKKRILPLWIFTAGGIAAALLVFLFWFFLSPVSKDQQITKTSLADHIKKSQHQKELPLKAEGAKGKDSLNISQPAAADEERTAVLSPPSQVITAEKQPVHQPAPTAGANTIFATVKPPIPVGVQKTGADIFSAPVNAPQTAVVYPKVQQVIPETIKTPVISIPAHATQTATANSPAHQILPETDSARVIRTANALAQSKDPLEKINKTEIERSIKKKMDAALQQQGHNLILSAMAAPDISSTSASKSSKVSSDLGMVASYAVLNKVSISSGAIYSKKYYNYGSTYNSGQQDWQVNADCNVLDVPLNVNYKLLDKKQLSVSMTAGVSSYFMLKEKYDNITGTGATQVTTTQVIDNQNQHIFGVANLGMSFNHQITQSVSIGVQPFAKLPLTGIGEHDANLKSVGMFFSLNIGLFSPKKPGKYASLWK